jgi:hypothetical protein
MPRTLSLWFATGGTVRDLAVEAALPGPHACDTLASVTNEDLHVRRARINLPHMTGGRLDE